MGVKASAEEVLVTSASQQSIDLISRVFLDEGDVVAIEDPSFISAIAAFRAHGAGFLPVAMDADGLDVDALRGELESNAAGGAAGARAPKFLYTVPDFQNPTGISLSLARRRELLALAREQDLLVVEDVPYRWLRYEGEGFPLLSSLDTERRVIGLFSFSKIFAPGLRVGWVVADAAIIDRLVQAKQSADLCTSAFSQAILAEYLCGDAMPTCLSRSIAMYRRKLALMREALEASMPRLPGLSWTAPRGGVFLWVRLPAAIDADALLPRAIERGVAYIPGSGFHANGGGRNTLRLCFSFPSEQNIPRGIRLLAEVIREAWEERGSTGGSP
jgi:2-aminoadipate transaminase